MTHADLTGKTYGRWTVLGDMQRTARGERKWLCRCACGAERYVLDDKKLLAGGVNLIDYIEPITDEDGQHRYGSTSKYILRSEEGEVLGILGVTRDITKDYLARQNFQKELKYLFELPSDIYAVSYIDIDSWRVISQRRQIGNFNGADFLAFLLIQSLRRNDRQFFRCHRIVPFHDNANKSPAPHHIFLQPL